jgi:hypothetical protein
MMTKTVPITYQKFWAFIYILVGLICGLIFLIGSFFLNETQYLFYTILAIAPLYIGFKMFNNPYAIVSKKEIIVYGIFGGIKHHYVLADGEQFMMIKNRIFIKTKGHYKKVKINHWFTKPTDWKSLTFLFSEDNENQIIHHLLSEND